MAEHRKPKGFSSALSYVDPKAAYVWLERAFGFEPVMVLLDAQDNLLHSEMKFGEAIVMIGSEWDDDHRSPTSVDGKNTQTVQVQLERGEDIDAHCARARQAGADILQEPALQFYGDRAYRARDPEGHVWTFSVTVQDMTREEWDKAAGQGVHTQTRL